MSEMNFRSEVKIDYERDGVQSSFRAKATVKWSLELEVREYGIKSFIVSIPDQEISFKAISIDENGCEEESLVCILIKNVSSVEPFEFNGRFEPSELSFSKNKWRLEF